MKASSSKPRAPYLKSAVVMAPPPPATAEAPAETKEEEGHWADYWFEGPPEESTTGDGADSEAGDEASAEPEAAPAAAAPLSTADMTQYPFSLPAVQALPDIAFAPVTILVGDNGSGKSTLVEGLAVAAGFNPEGGSRNLQFETHGTHSRLSEQLRLSWYARPRWGWFFRAETFYGMATHIERDNDPLAGVASMFPDLHNRSHGESFLTLAESRLNSNGLYFLDEVESALSFQGQLRLLLIMQQACAKGAQFVIATHSPILMAFPGASIVELSADGANSVPYDDILAVQLWRRFLADPTHHLNELMQ